MPKAHRPHPASRRPGLPGLPGPGLPVRHPLSLLVTAVAGVIAVLGAHHLALSLGALATGLLLTRGRTLRLATLSMIPVVSAGFLLMYAPFGTEPGWWIFTRDGTTTALTLAARILGATAWGLGWGSRIDADPLMRYLQPRVPAGIVYVLGSTLRLLPMARQRWESLQLIHRSRGIEPRRRALLLPLVVGLVDDAAGRARPLQHTGFDLPGRRTVLDPVPDHPASIAYRIAVLLAALALVILI